MTLRKLILSVTFMSAALILAPKPAYAGYWFHYIDNKTIDNKSAPKAVVPRALTPEAIDDLKATTSIVKQYLRQNDPKNYQLLIKGYASVRHRCERAAVLTNRLQGADYVDQASTQQGDMNLSYTNPNQLFNQYKDPVTVSALKKSISEKMARIYKLQVEPNLPSQTLVTWLRQQKPTQMPQDNILREFINLRLNDPEHLVANAQIYFQTLATTVNSSNEDYLNCVKLVDEIGLGQP